MISQVPVLPTFEELRASVQKEIEKEAEALLNSVIADEISNSRRLLAGGNRTSVTFDGDMYVFDVVKGKLATLGYKAEYAEQTHVDDDGAEWTEYLIWISGLSG